MSYFLPHLPSGWHVDEAIKSEEDRVVVIRFGHDWDTQCMTMDETLYGVAEKVQNFAVIYLVDITEVPDFNKVRTYHSLEIPTDVDFGWYDCGRCTSCTIRARSCSSTGACSSPSASHQLLTRSVSSFHRNKHIMIDLGTGNNNKMCVF